MWRTPGICLKGIGDFRGNSRAAAERLQGTVKAIRGRLVAVGNAVGAGAGGWEYLRGGVRAGVLEGGIPPPQFQAISWRTPYPRAGGRGDWAGQSAGRFVFLKSASSFGALK